MALCGCSLCTRHRSHNPDRLSSLPPELLRYIVRLVYGTNKRQYLGGVSHVFLSIARELVFRRVEVRSFDRLALLCGLVRKSSELADFVEDLTIDMEDVEQEEYPRTKKVYGLFRRLVNLACLAIHNTPRLAHAVLTPPLNDETGEMDLLPNMQCLDLVDPFDNFANPFNPIHWAELDSYPSLHALDLNVERPVSSLRDNTILPDKHDNYLALSSLRLCAFLRGNHAVKAFLGFFPYLAGANVFDYTAHLRNNLGRVIRSIPEPKYLTYLSLGQQVDGAEDLAKALKPFVHLKTLEFGAGSFASPVVATLSKLPKLERLTFSRWTSVSTSDLAAILSGPTACKALKKVRLDMASRTRRTDDPVNEDEKSNPLVGLTKGFTVDGLVPLLDVAETLGIELSGLVVELAKQKKRQMGEEKAKRKARREQQLGVGA
ncbi:hypothetical protein JCM10213_007663 [Rhodosporidiobolus nylandii]